MAGLFEVGQNVKSLFDGMDTTVPARSKEYTSRLATDLTRIKELRDSETPYPDLYRQSYNEVKNTQTITDAFEANISQHVEQIKKDWTAVAEETITDDPEQTEQQLEVAEELSVIDSVYSGARGGINLTLEQYADESISELAVRQEEANQYGQYVLGQWMEEQGTFSNIVDFGSHVLFSPDFFVDARQLTEALTGEKSGMNDVIAEFQKQDPDVQAALIDEIFPRAVEAFDGNSSKVALYVGMLTSPEFKLEMGVEAAFAAFDAAGYIGAAAKIAKSFRSVGKLAKVNRYAAAAENLKAGGVRDRLARDAIAGDETDVALNASPVHTEGTALDQGNVDNISAESQAIARNAKEEVAQRFDEIASENFLIETDAFTSQERLIAQREFINERQDRLGEELLGDIQFDETREGFTATYKRIQNGKETTEEIPVRLTRNDVGTLDMERIQESRVGSNAIFGFTFSPETLFRGQNIVETATMAGNQSARLVNELKDIRNTSIKGLSSREVRDIDELLIKGDVEGREFTPDELRAGGVELSSGTKAFSDAEIRSYYMNRQLLDEIHGLKDRNIREELAFNGYKDVRFNSGKGVEQVEIARPVDSVPNNSVVNVPKRGKNANQHETLSSARIEEMKANGFTFLERLDPEDIEGVGKVKYVAVVAGGKGSPAVIKNLPSKVLKYRPGYVPRIYKPGQYFVKNVKKNRNVERVFGSKSEAEQWINGQSNSKQLRAFIDEKLDPADRMIEEANKHGGLYSGTRSDSPLLYGREGEQVPRLTAAQSIDAYMRHIADVMPMNEFRQSTLTRFKNTVNAFARQEGKSTGFADPLNHNSTLMIEDTSIRSWLENSRDYINSIMKLPSSEERHFQNAMISVAEWIDGSRPFGEKASKGAARKIIDITSSDPSTALRGAAFNTMLGFFNPRQLWVQAQNAAIAMSAHPTQAPRALGQAVAMRAGIFVPESGARNSIVKMTSKGIDDSGDVAQSIEQFRRSGLMDSILRNADYDAAAAGFASGTRRVATKTASKGRVFFNEGELSSRLVTWNIARNMWKKANPGRAIDDTAIKEITDEVYRLQMNMQRENAAKFQTNKLTSVPTQFLQVLAKFSENTIQGLTGKGKWTRAETGRIIAGQLLLYGTAGVPAGNWALGQIKKFSGMSDEEIANDPEARAIAEAAHDGMWGVIFEAAGAENVVGESGSIVSMLGENVLVDVIKGLVTLGEEDVGIAEAFMGPSQSVLSRATDGTMTSIRAMYGLFKTPSYESLGETAFTIGESLARLTSTYNNAEKAWMLHHYNQIRSTRGSLVADRTDFGGDVSVGTVLGQALGFTTDVEQFYWDTRGRIAKGRAGQRKATDVVVNTILEFGPNEDYKDSILEVVLAPYTPLERQEIMRSALNRLAGRSNFKSTMEQLIQRHIKSNGREAIGSDAYKFIGESE